MIVPHAYRNKTVGVFGLARTGMAAVKALQAAGAHIWAWDDDAARQNIVKECAVDLYEADFSALDALVLAPGVPLYHPRPHPLVEKARKADIPIIGDIELFAQARSMLPPHQVVAITGTNGKSTTAALIAHMIKSCGRPAALAGNIGVPVLSLPPLPAGGVYVFELSSFQIDLTQRLDSDLAVLLNVTPDHLDRHGSFEDYIRAKERLFEMQKAPHCAIICVDDEPGQLLAARLMQPVITVSLNNGHSADICVTADGKLQDQRSTEPGACADLSAVKNLPGRHNWQNMVAAYAVGTALGLAPAAILESFAEFPGLRHRCELVGEWQGIRFINDSKATNLDAAKTALSAFDHIRWLAGGRAKSSSFDELTPYFDRIDHAYLYGEAAPLLAQALDGKIAYSTHETVMEAVDAASRDAQHGDTVLFSPACASFDQFPDFEARGEAFRQAALRIIEGRAA